ncbi:MAG TPA: DUF2127 domain-containing protein [Candidatus Paceibacterota bacterium]
MKLLPEKDYHELFRIGIMVKAADGCIEACAGIFFYFIGYNRINAILFRIFHEEIAESPRDAFWQFMINQWHAISLSSTSFWGLLFVAHGAIKLLLSIALLKDKFWAYPAAAAVFTLFVGFEIYSLANRPSLFLWLITIFDAIVVGLILHEYRHIKKART